MNVSTRFKLKDEMELDSSEKKILDKSPVVSGLMVPLAIVLVGALIIFGVTKMLSTDRSYQDLVREMESKSFGNKWVAAYELSKVIASSQIPKEEIPALISRLSDIYSSPSADPRTRDFIVVALGALDSPHSLPILKKALGDPDKNVKFHAITSIGNMSKENLILDWGALLDLLKSSDKAIQQAAVLTLGTHKVLKSEPLIEKLLNSEDVGVKYAAARVLIKFKNVKAVPFLKDILLLESGSKKSTLDAKQIEILKLEVLKSVKKEEWSVLNDAIKKLSEKSGETKVALKALEVLKVLKN